MWSHCHWDPNEGSGGHRSWVHQKLFANLRKSVAKLWKAVSQPFFVLMRHVTTQNFSQTIKFKGFGVSDPKNPLKVAINMMTEAKVKIFIFKNYFTSKLQNTNFLFEFAIFRFIIELLIKF